MSCARVEIAKKKVKCPGYAATFSGQMQEHHILNASAHDRIGTMFFHGLAPPSPGMCPPRVPPARGAQRARCIRVCAVLCIRDPCCTWALQATVSLRSKSRGHILQHGLDPGMQVLQNVWCAWCAGAAPGTERGTTFLGTMTAEGMHRQWCRTRVLFFLPLGLCGLSRVMLGRIGGPSSQLASPNPPPPLV